MSLLYCTADKIGGWGGGPTVTAQELLAIREFSDQVTRSRNDPNLSSVEVFSRDNLGSNQPEPWKWDDVACNKKDWFVSPPKLAHFYSGTFGKTIEKLKRNGCKVIHTIAAHDREISRREHEKLGMAFPYEHLTNEKLWNRYISGYRLADVIVCPSTVAEKTVRAYGPEFENKDIRIIPHGCHLPTEIAPLPHNFVVGYLGSCGAADKGVRYLLEAWKKLNYKDGSLLVLAGMDSNSQWVRHLVNTYGGGSIHLAGWQENVSDFYSQISLYVQPSASEGFGIEVLESMAHGRAVVCSEGAGAVDMLDDQFGSRRTGGLNVPACNTDAIADCIEMYKTCQNLLITDAKDGRKLAEEYTWDKIRAMYCKLWKETI